MARTGLSRHFMLKENISWEGSFTASQKTLVDKPNTHSHCIQVFQKNKHFEGSCELLRFDAYKLPELLL